MVNPFDLRGPQFLLLYLALGVLVALVARHVLHSREAGASSPRPLHDYLDIAFLRGGTAEAIRVAILTLLDRGLLRIVGSKQVEAVGEKAAKVVAKATEQRILAKCAAAAEIDAIVADRSIVDVARAECEPGLIRQGLLPSDEQRAYRKSLFGTSALVLFAIAGVKSAVGVSRGRPIEFLIVLAIVFVIVVYRVTHPRQTAAGRSVLGDMRTLLGGLKSSVPSSGVGAGNDLALLAAVFGVGAALPHHPEARKLFPAGTSSDGSTSSGSSCGSSGSSCGSSCGGGGGGCGGCGS